MAKVKVLFSLDEEVNNFLDVYSDSMAKTKSGFINDLLLDLKAKHENLFLMGNKLTIPELLTHINDAMQDLTQAQKEVLNKINSFDEQTKGVQDGR